MLVYMCRYHLLSYYHTQAIRHIRHPLLIELAQTLACSLILSRIDYCNSVLHGAPIGTIQKVQRFHTTTNNCKGWLSAYMSSRVLAMTTTSSYYYYYYIPKFLLLV